MSRPKGSKNKPRITDVAPVIQPVSTVATDTPVGAVATKNSEKVEQVVFQVGQVLTKTMFGTPISIVGIMKSSKFCDFVVVPNSKSKGYQTTVNANSVVKPEFVDEDVAKKFEGIAFYVLPTVAPNDVPDVANDAQTVETPEAVAKQGKDTLNAGI
jgi:hypothetical protein